MARLIGRFLLSIDDKGRLVLPAAHRSRYAEGAILSPKTNHVAIYEPVEWDRFIGRLKEYRTAGEISREDFNWVTMNAADPRPDSAGRIVLPSWIREHLDLAGEALVAGADDYLAIYRPDYAESVDPETQTRALDKINVLGL